MTKLEFITKHQALLTEFLELETDLSEWMSARTDREVHVLAHFMFLCHSSAQILSPIVSQVANARGIGRQIVPIEEL